MNRQRGMSNKPVHGPKFGPNYVGTIRITYPDHLYVLSFDGQMQRRLQIDVLHVELGVRPDQQLCDLDVVVEGGQV